MDPNLLPNELRVGEKEELSHPPQPTSVKPDAVLSSKDKVTELNINVGLWSKIKAWLNKDESPGTEVKSVAKKKMMRK